jgi:cyclopropane-fatty-acyl-phospholipid synthase
MFSLVIVAIMAVIGMLLAWLWQQDHKNAGIVDVIWAFGLMLAGPWYAFTGHAPLFLKIALAALTFTWFARLGSYLTLRVFRTDEDSRYRSMRLAMQPYASVGFLVFFLIQAGFIWLFSLPFWAVAQNQQPDLYWVIAAMLLASISFRGESRADQQLAEFKRKPENHGLSCREGLWKYSRHPNYFFEWLHWFAYPMMGWGGEYQYYLCLAPLVMFCFLSFLTGIPFAEQQALLHRGEDYRRYQLTTNRFFPWWPKSVAGRENNE